MRPNMIEHEAQVFWSAAQGLGEGTAAGEAAEALTALDQVARLAHLASAPVAKRALSLLVLSAQLSPLAEVRENAAELLSEVPDGILSS